MLLHRSQVRLLRFWEARNVRRRGGEVMGVDILLHDSQVTFKTLIQFIFKEINKSDSTNP